MQKKIGSSGHGNYWNSFKTRKPQDAKAIEDLCGRNMDIISDADAFQIVSTFLRWSKNTGAPIAKLKDNFIDQMKSFLADGATFDMLISRLKSEKQKEAKEFGISEDFTITSFMYEWLIEMKDKEEKDLWSERLAKNLNVQKDKLNSFKGEIEKKEEELNLAPDISQLDREENKLFALANKGVNQLIELSTSNDKTYRLNENGKFEARILCSTMVMDLHSHFKNEIDLGIQTDRYFLLLMNSITGDYPEDEIGFVNSRIAFYNDFIKNIKIGHNYKTTNSFLAKTFNFLYLNPLSTTIENDLQKNIISHDETISLQIAIEDIINDMEVGRLLITSAFAQKIKQEYLSTVSSMIPENKKKLLNQDVAWVFADEAISMIKSGNIHEKVASVLPHDIILRIRELSDIYHDNNELSTDQIDSILNNAKDEFIKTFNK